MTTIIDGKAIAARYKEDARRRAEVLKSRGVVPCLAVVLVGENPASLSYVRGKQKALVETGMAGRDIRLDESVSEAELLSLIAVLNADVDVHGILVQLPMPGHIRKEMVINSIDPRKDVDCFHPVSAGKFFLGQESFIPCTPQGVEALIRESGIPLPGSHVVVVGRSNIVGKPLAALLARREQNCTVTLCHTGTTDLASHTQRADILVVAAGKAGLIKGDMIKKGAAVIDVGINRVPDSSPKGYSLVGDVLFEEAVDIAGWITPVPGGVGPMTIAMLMQNVVLAAEQR
ncbi:MAG: bifunctional 5,10-methylenetetrahydrofolate dehydrogenase/5,10-methenyltetrahydrofolate cyclohydrolase [Treponema sp.]|nr:bifunctional 5,10-methylenetetrahydrofolate dehydrogenase/5,10-methenyltetrahydrofolate cyclohydrolase [Treponema sp.]